MFGAVFSKFVCSSGFAGMFAGAIIYLVLQASFTTSFEQTDMLLTKDGRVLATFQDPAAQRMFWDGDPLLQQEYRLVSFAKKTMVYAMKGPRSITKNPKVMEMDYELEIERLGTPNSYFAEQAALKKYGHRNIREYISYWLIEFNNQNSMQLSEINNSLDSKSQNRFKLLIIPFLDQPLGDIQAEFRDAWIVKELAEEYER